MNQLQTLVKRGLTPGLGQASNLPVSDTKSDNPSPLPKLAASKVKQKLSHFITKAGAAIVILGVSRKNSEKSKGGRLGNPKHDSGQTLQGDGHDLKNVVGRSDGRAELVGDIERMCLERWGGTTRD